MTDPQHLQQLIQVEDERVETLLKCLKYEVEQALTKTSELRADGGSTTFISIAFYHLKTHLTRRDTLRELLTK